MNSVVDDAQNEQVIKFPARDATHGHEVTCVQCGETVGLIQAPASAFDADGSYRCPPCRGHICAPEQAEPVEAGPEAEQKTLEDFELHFDNWTMRMYLDAQSVHEYATRIAQRLSSGAVSAAVAMKLLPKSFAGDRTAMDDSKPSHIALEGALAEFAYYALAAAQAAAVMDRWVEYYWAAQNEEDGMNSIDQDEFEKRFYECLNESARWRADWNSSGYTIADFFEDEATGE